MIFPPVSAQVASDLPMANLLALDQSSRTTGFTVLKNGKIEIVSHFECVGDDLGDRLV
jgi:hypothetical protein